jgi:hypothetical protein
MRLGSSYLSLGALGARSWNCERSRHGDRTPPYGVSSRFGSLRTPGAAKSLIFIASPAVDFRSESGRLAKRQPLDFFDAALPLSYVKSSSLKVPLLVPVAWRIGYWFGTICRPSFFFSRSVVDIGLQKLWFASLPVVFAVVAAGFSLGGVAHWFHDEPPTGSASHPAEVKSSENVSAADREDSRPAGATPIAEAKAGYGIAPKTKKQAAPETRSEQMAPALTIFAEEVEMAWPKCNSQYQVAKTSTSELLQLRELDVRIESVESLTTAEVADGYELKAKVGGHFRARRQFNYSLYDWKPWESSESQCNDVEGEAWRQRGTWKAKVDAFGACNVTPAPSCAEVRDK